MQIEEYEKNYKFEEMYWWYMGRMDWKKVEPVDPILFEMIQEYRKGKPQQIRKYLKKNMGLNEVKH